jgi:hypothetical protein
VTANAGRSLHQNDFKAGIGDVQGRLNAGHPTADYQRPGGDRTSYTSHCFPIPQLRDQFLALEEREGIVIANLKMADLRVDAKGDGQ